MVTKSPIPDSLPTLRVQRLYAAMIKRVVKSRWSYTISDGDAMSLALYPQLSVALSTLQNRLDIVKFPDPKKGLALAIGETAVLAGNQNHDYAQKQILNARKTAYALLDEQRKANKEAKYEEAALKKLMFEIDTWGTVHTRFVKRVERLYLDTLSKLKQIGLSERRLGQACEELNVLVEHALERGMNLIAK